MPRLGSKAKAAILASFDHVWALQTDVFQRMPESTTSSVTNSTFPFHIHDRVLLNELKSIRAVLSKLVLRLGSRAVMKTHLFIGLIGSARVDVVRRLCRGGRRGGSEFYSLTGYFHPFARGICMHATHNLEPLIHFTLTTSSFIILLLHRPLFYKYCRERKYLGTQGRFLLKVYAKTL